MKSSNEQADRIKIILALSKDRRILAQAALTSVNNAFNRTTFGGSQEQCLGCLAYHSRPPKR